MFLIAEIVFFPVLKRLLIMYFSLSVRCCQCRRIICRKIKNCFDKCCASHCCVNSRPTVVACVGEIRSGGRNNCSLSVQWLGVEELFVKKRNYFEKFCHLSLWGFLSFVSGNRSFCSCKKARYNAVALGQHQSFHYHCRRIFVKQLTLF